jgi:hypothetical protein
VGYVLPSLSSSLGLNAAGTLASITSFSTCAGNTLFNLATQAQNFTVVVKELTNNAFRPQTPQAGVSEQGSLVLAAQAGLAATTGLATQATEIQLAFANVPALATIYLPVSVTSGGTTLSLVGAVSASLTNVIGLAANGGAGSTAGVYGFTASATGTLNVVYVVTNYTATGTTFNFPIFVGSAGGASPVQATAMTVATSYVPAAALSGPATFIPTFAVSAAPGLNTITVTACATSLLFPYVTNSSGFETGIAISNTTTDNLFNNGVPLAGKSSAQTPTNGSCTLNFYGNVTPQPTAWPVPTIGAFTAATATAAEIDPTYANILTNMLAGKSGFTGYAIALCNFTQAHGFAFISDTNGLVTGPMGYLAVVIPNSRNEQDPAGGTEQ